MPTRPVRFRALGKILLEALSHLRPGDLRCSVPIEILFSLWLSLCRCHHSSPLVSCAFVSTRLQFCSPLRAVHLRASALTHEIPLTTASHLSSRLASLERDISSQSLTQRRTFSKSLFGLILFTLSVRKVVGTTQPGTGRKG